MLSRVSHAVPLLIPLSVALSAEGSIVAFRRLTSRLRSQPVEAAMDPYIHNANIQHYRRLIAESERNPKRDEDRHKMLLTLLAEEKAKDKQEPLDIYLLA